MTRSLESPDVTPGPRRRISSAGPAGSGVLDPLDRQLVQALSVDGRAKLSEIAAVLGITNQTIARRYRKLRETGAVRVLGRLDARSLGQPEWVVRLHCKPGRSLSVAQALAEREDTSWVRLAAGGTEIICKIQPSGQPDLGALLLDKLAAGGAVTAVSAHAMLHVFLGGPTTWHGVTSALTEQQVARLMLPWALTGQVTPVELDDGDRLLLGELARDGRATNEALAAATGWHESTVRRRITHLRAAGALYFEVDVDERFLGHHTNAALWMSVEPSKLPAVGAALAGHGDVLFAAATTGATNLLASIMCPDDYALYDSIVNHVGLLPGIREIAAAPIGRTVKRSGAVG